MDKKVVFIVLFFVTSMCLGQNVHLKIMGSNSFQTKILDSLDYSKTFINKKEALEEIKSLQHRLILNGFFENKIENKSDQDTILKYKINLGEKTNFIHIYIGEKKENKILTPNSKNDTLIIAISESENFLNSILKKLENEGFPLAKVKLENIRKKNTYLIADLKVENYEERKINKVIFVGYDKFPKSYKNNIIRMFSKVKVSQDNLDKMYSNIQKIRFVKQPKYPEILFKRDSTLIYVYLEKTKSNSFDGFIGFSNNESRKVNFNGYLDLSLNNILNSGEKFTLNWRSNGNQQKNFDLAFEIPYVFNTPLALKSQLNIFQQDSTFQNTKTLLDIGYLLKHNSRLYIGYQSTESSDIQNINNNFISDFENSFITAGYDFINFSDENYLFPEKTNIIFKGGLGKRKSKTINDTQFFLSK